MIFFFYCELYSFGVVVVVDVVVVVYGNVGNVVEVFEFEVVDVLYFVELWLGLLSFFVIGR